MDRVYVIMDYDMRGIVSVCKTKTTVMKYILNTLTCCGYEKFTFEVINDDYWEVTFPHDDSNCAGHFIITREEVEE